jgi:hypothetical protein
MANSKHLAIRAGAAAAVGTVAGGRVHQNRQFTLAKGVVSQVHVNFRGSEPEQVVQYANHPRDWETDLQIVVLARKDGATEACDVVDALWVEIYGLLMADQSLGGLADYLVPQRVEVGDDQADTSVCRLEWFIQVRHRTADNSIAA